MSTYSLDFVASVRGVQAELAKIPGMTEKAAASAALKQVNEHRKALAKVEQANAKGAEKSVGTWGQAFKKIGAAAGYGDLIEKTANLSEGLSVAGAAGTVAAAGVVAVGVAAGAAAVAAVSLTRAAQQSIETLEKFGQNDLVSKDQRDQVWKAAAALDAMGVVADAVKVTLAAGLAPAVIAVASSIGETTMLVNKVARAFDTGALSVKSWGALLGVFVIQPVLLATKALALLESVVADTGPLQASAQGWQLQAEALADAAFEVQATTDAQLDAITATTDFGKVLEDVLKVNYRSTLSYSKLTEAVKRQEEATRAATQAELEMLAERGQSWLQYAQDQQAAQDAADAEHQAALALWDQASSAWHEMQDGQVAADEAAAKARREANIAEANEKLGLMAQVGSAAEDLFALEQQRHEAKLGQLRKELAQAQKNAKSNNALISAMGEADAEMIRDQIKRHQKAATRAFRAQQAAAIAGAVMSGAQAYLAVMASPAIASMAFGAPLAALAITGPPTALQIASIASQKPPQFARGGEVQATLHDGEGIANRRAMANPNFRAQLDQANEGRGGGSGDGNVTNVFLNDRLLLQIYGRMRRLAGEPRLAGV